MATFTIQMGRLHARTAKTVEELVQISGFLDGSYRSPSRWCASCEVHHQSTLICLPPWLMSPSTFRLLIELLDGTLPHSSEIYFPDCLFQLADYFLISLTYVVDMYLEYLCSRLFSPSQLVEIVSDFLSQQSARSFVLGVLTTLEGCYSGVVSRILRVAPTLLDDTSDIFWD